MRADRAVYDPEPWRGEHCARGQCVGRNECKCCCKRAYNPHRCHISENPNDVWGQYPDGTAYQADTGSHACECVCVCVVRVGARARAHVCVCVCVCACVSARALTNRVPSNHAVPAVTTRAIYNIIFLLL